ncbi:MAG: ankyrin repeat domain-containing protein [Acidobacteriota bacterium]
MPEPSIQPEPRQTPEFLAGAEITRRLTLGGLWRDFARKFFSLEQGLWHTVKGLTLAPGEVIRGYLAGDRQRYLNPFTYLVFCYLVALSVYALVDYKELAIEGTRQQLAESVAETGRELPPELEKLSVGVQEWIVSNGHYLSLFICIPFAFLMRFLLRKRGINLAECFVFALFCIAHMSLTMGVLALLYLIPGVALHVQRHSLIGLLILAIISGRAAAALFGRSWRPVGATWLAGLAGYGAMAVVGFMIGLGYTVYLARVVGLQMNVPNLHRAAEQGELDLARKLLDDGAEIDEPVAARPLHLAAAAGNLDMVTLLLERGADPNLQDHLGRVPMASALEEGQGEIARMLLEAGTAPGWVLEDGRTLLMLAVGERQHDLVESLLALGADPNVARGNRQATALMRAARLNEPQIATLLLEHGADPTVVNDRGETAADLALGKDLEAQLRLAIDGWTPAPEEEPAPSADPATPPAPPPPAPAPAQAEVTPPAGR